MFDEMILSHTVIDKPIDIYEVCTIFNYIFSANYGYGGEYHDAWEMVVCYDGRAKIYSDGNEFYVGRNQMFLHKPMEEHNISTPNKPASIGIVSFRADSEALYEIADTIIDCSDYINIFSMILTEGVIAFAGQNNMPANDASTGLFGAKHLIKNLCEIFLIKIYRKCFPTQNKTPVTAVRGIRTLSSFVNDVIIYMQKNIYRPLSLKELSDKFGYSKEYICTLFKKHMGQSVIEYYNNLRIDQAKLLISQNKYAINDLYKKLNFSSRQYFSTLFKKVTGISPSVYAKNLRIYHAENWTI